MGTLALTAEIRGKGSIPPAPSCGVRTGTERQLLSGALQLHPVPVLFYLLPLQVWGVSSPRVLH